MNTITLKRTLPALVLALLLGLTIQSSSARERWHQDPATGQGYVYLPGKSDEPYRLNTKAIYRGREGNWFRANAAWQAAFSNVVHG